MVLCCCTKEGYASDVNLLNGIREGAFRLRDGRGKGVQVADDDGDGGDALGLEILLVRSDVSSKNACGSK